MRLNCCRLCRHVALARSSYSKCQCRCDEVVRWQKTCARIWTCERKWQIYTILYNIICTWPSSSSTPQIQNNATPTRRRDEQLVVADESACYKNNLGGNQFGGSAWFGFRGAAGVTPPSSPLMFCVWKWRVTTCIHCADGGEHEFVDDVCRLINGYNSVFFSSHISLCDAHYSW